MIKKRETRSLKVRELRATTSEDGKQYLEGRAASYNVLSEDFGYWRERIAPGAFSRAISEKHDVRHLINHDRNLVLGRTEAGTLELSEDENGLTFRTLVPDTSYARDLVVSVERGDINECSFGFYAVNTAWIEEPDAADPKQMMYVRELRDLDLFDISTVTYPAYPETNTELEARSLPEDVPAEVRTKFEQRDKPEVPAVDDWKTRAEMRLRIAQVLQ
jgi:HK97 family phage prohead protease